jgi:hypothetical protein
MSEIATELGLTRERIRQICLRFNIPTTTPRVYTPLICLQCGLPYDPPRDRLPAVHGSGTVHLNLTGHHPRPRRMPSWQPSERLQQMMELHAQGKTSGQISTEVGVPLSYVSWQLRRVGMAGSYKVERDSAIIADWERGDTYAVLAQKHKLKRTRLRQIVGAYIRTGGLPYATRGESAVAEEVAPVPVTAPGVVGPGG